MTNPIDRLLDLARAAVGLHAGQSEFRALIAPGEPERGAEFERLSTCALFLRGLLARWLCFEAGVTPGNPRPATVPPRIWAPYRNGMAMADIAQMCTRYKGEWLWEIKPGAILIVGTRGHEQRALLVESVERDGWPDGSIEYTAIEAGQADEKGRQCVKRRKHEVDLRDADVATAFQGGGGVWSHGVCSTRRAVTYILDSRVLLGGAS